MPALILAATVLLALVLAGIGVLVLASAIRGGLRVRRFLQGLLLVLAGASFLGFVLLLDGRALGTRDYLVVYGGDLERAPSEETLRQLRTLLANARQVSFLRLESGAEEPSSTRVEPPGPAGAAEALAGGWPGIARRAAALRARQPNSSGEGNDPDEAWLKRLVERAENILLGGARLAPPWSQPTLLVLIDDGEPWSGLRVPGSATWPLSLRQLLSRHIQLFLLRVPDRPRPARAEILLDREPLPAGSSIDLSAVAHVLLADLPPAEQQAATFQAAFDDSAFRRPQPIRLRPDTERGGMRFDFKLGSNVPAWLTPGFHRLAVEVRVEQPGEPIARSFTAVRYFRVDEPREMIFANGLGSLAREGWKLPEGRPLGDFLAAVLLQPQTATANRQRFSSLSNLTAGERVTHQSWTSLGRIDIVPFPASGGLPEEVLERFRQARAVILVEPTRLELSALSHDLKLEEAIRAGLEVVVIGPPPRGDGVESENDWLPARAVRPQRDRDEPLRAFRDPRLYVVPDNSRVTQLPWSADPAGRTTLQDAQRKVLAGVYRGLGLPDSPASNTWKIDLPDQEREAKLGGRMLRVFPPVDLTSDLSELFKDYQSPVRGALLDAVPAGVSVRLRSLLGETGGLYFSTSGVRYPHLHTATVVLLFTLDLPQADTLQGAAGTPLRLDPGGPSAPHAAGEEVHAADLESLGIRVIRVKLRVPEVYREFYAGALGRAPRDAAGALTTCARDLPCRMGGAVPGPFRGNPLTRPGILEIGAEDNDQVLGASAAQILHQIDEWLPPAPSTGHTLRQRAGRVIDERAAPKPAAPLQHFVLDASPDSKLAGPHAVIADSRPEKEILHTPLPGVVVRHLGEGHAVALAASPWARDLWAADSDRLPAGKGVNGWGVQRLLDPVDLTGAARPLSDLPIVREIRELADGRTLEVDVWSRLYGSGDWREPAIEEAGHPRELRVVNVDPTAQRITLQYRPESAVQGFRDLILGKPDELGLEVRQPIYLSLRGGAAGGRTIRELLAVIATHSGGAVIDPVRDRDLAVARRDLEHALPESWVAGAALCFVLLLLFSPFVRPWTAAGEAWRSWRSRRRRGSGLVSPQARFNVEAVLTEWGHQPGAPSAARRAGTPASEKPWDSGDDLASARRASLVPFTSLGRSMGLPPRRPRLRQRHVTRAMEAVILLDDSRSLLVPAGPGFTSKRDFSTLIASLLAQVVWAQAGSVRAATARPPGASWGPSTSDDDAAALEAFLQGHLARLHRPAGSPGGLILPDLEPGHVLFLVTDLMALEEHDLDPLLRRCAQDGVSLRVAHVLDREETRRVGLVWNAEAGVVHDRSEWDPAELAQAYAARAARFRDLVERAEGRFATLATESLGVALGEELRDQGFLS